MDRIAEWLVLGAAALTAAGWMGRKVLRVVKLLEALAAVVTRELTHNSGTSMKDDVHGTAISTQQIAGRVDALEHALATLAEANHLIWPAIEAVAKAQPPEGETP